jgi:putative flippase GtrA
MPATIHALGNCAQPLNASLGVDVPRGGTPLRRWVVFNAVGAAGMAVQLAVVATLVHFRCHYLVATVLAVESAIVHNFLWHQRWTWRDRPAQSSAETAVRLVRFHILNGTVSLLGNVFVTAWGTGIIGLNPIVSNVIAIGLCSLLNFVFSETMVFSARCSKHTTWSAPQIGVMLLVAVAPVVDAGPGASTLAAWRDYEARVDLRYKAASSSGGQFFALDDDNQSRGWRNDVLHGQPRTIKIDAPSVDDGKIHHWVGAIFVPGTTVSALIDRLEQNAGHESEHYEDVLASRLIARNGDHVQVYMKLRRTNLITVSYNTEHSVDYRRITTERASARSVATKIAELADAGTPHEREKPATEDNGFLWRLNAYWRYEAVPGGVLVECESVSLSRPVPALLRPVANPIVDRIARESLNKTLLTLQVVGAEK